MKIFLQILLFFIAQNIYSQSIDDILESSIKRTFYTSKSETGTHQRSKLIYNNKEIFNVQLYEFKSNNINYKQLQVAPLYIEVNDSIKIIKDRLTSGFVISNDEIIDCFKQIIHIDNLPYLIYVNTDFDIISSNPLFSAYTDTIINCSVFLPDPLTSSSSIYGAPIDDKNNGTYTDINDQIFTKQVSAQFDNGTFYLSNKHLIVKELDAPVVNVSTKTDKNFLFNRSDTGFEETNAFYHITKFSEYIKDTLGYGNLMNYQLQIDVHANGGGDNSFFLSSTTPPQILFGDGGVDDAEDAEILIHEYVHALTHSAAPNTNFGTERTAIDEALGDYFANSYSMTFSTYNWERTFPWDGHNEFWNGRVANTSKTYADYGSNKYEIGEILVDPLMKLRAAIGVRASDKLIIEACFGLSANMKMSEFGKLLMQKDTLLNNSKNADLIQSLFCEKLIFTSCPKSIKHFDFNQINIDYSKLSNHKKLTLLSNESFSIRLYDSSGKLIISEGNTNEIDIQHLPKGVYIANIKYGQNYYNVSIVR